MTSSLPFQELFEGRRSIDRALLGFSVSLAADSGGAAFAARLDDAALYVWIETVDRYLRQVEDRVAHYERELKLDGVGCCVV